MVKTSTHRALQYTYIGFEVALCNPKYNFAQHLIYLPMTPIYLQLTPIHKLQVNVST